MSRFCLLKGGAQKAGTAAPSLLKLNSFPSENEPARPETDVLWTPRLQASFMALPGRKEGRKEVLHEEMHHHPIRRQ